jgi:hypothetical protein
MRTRILLVACAALALSVGVSTAAAAGGNGNSDAAKACQNDGWKNLVRSENASVFKNTGDCVSYAAQGGTLSPKSRAQNDCESAGGTFSTDPATDVFGPRNNLIFTCNNAPSQLGSQFTPYRPVHLDCLLYAIPGGAGVSGTFNTAGPPFNFSCYRTMIASG